MGKRLLPIEKIYNTLDKLVKVEKEKWESGINNDYFEMESIVTDLKDCYEDNKRLSDDNYQLRRYNERLANEVKHLKECRDNGIRNEDR